MYVCYVDESGHCGSRENPDQPVEVLCGIVSDLTKLSKSQREHNSLLDQLGIREIKASEAYRGRKAWGLMKPTDRDALFDRMLEWASERACKFLVSPVDSLKFFARKAAGCSISARLRAPWQVGALHILLALQRHQQGKQANKGRTMVIFDEQKEHDEHLLQLISGDLAFTDGFCDFDAVRPRGRRRLDQIIDVPHFSKSHPAVLLQIADWAAFVVRRALLLRVYGKQEDYVGEPAKVERWYRGVEQLTVSSAAHDPSRAADALSCYLRADIRPNGWSFKAWP